MEMSESARKPSLEPVKWAEALIERFELFISA
jgi:hypothetical protein